MAIDLSAGKTIDMIDHLYQSGVQTVSKDDVVAEAQHEDLGADGIRIIQSLQPGDYTKEQLIVSISGALVNQGGHGT